MKTKLPHVHYTDLTLGPHLVTCDLGTDHTHDVSPEGKLKKLASYPVILVLELGHLVSTTTTRLLSHL